jgi:peptidoglycan/xylan/chitin deacetylase (PgdA/CDA1 family)
MKLKDFTITLRKSIYFVLGYINTLGGKENISPFVLCYHSFANDEWLHGVSLKQLNAQLKFLTQNYQPLRAKDIEKIISGRKFSANSFLITIDDGYTDVLKSINLFRQFNIKPILFLLSNPKKANREELQNNKKFLSTEQIKKLVKEGWIIGSHSFSHSDFHKLSTDEIKKEVLGSKNQLERRLGIKIEYFAYPRGRYTGQIIEAVQHAGYKLAFSMDDGYVNIETNQFIIPRIGINRSHSLKEFKNLYLPYVMSFRDFAKRGFGKGAIA